MSPDISKLREFVERSCWKDNPSCIVTEVQEDDDGKEEEEEQQQPFEMMIMVTHLHQHGS